MADEEQRLRDIQREYLDFLDDEVTICFNHICRTLSSVSWKKAAN